MTTFGVELEHASPISRERLAGALNTAGLRAVTALHSGRAYDRWQVKDDVTIPTSAATPERAEVVSPVLTWDDAASLEQLATACQVASDAGGRILRPHGRYSAGLHVHVSFQDLTPAQLAAWGRIWQGQQATTDTLVRSGRETGGAHARWCAVLSDRSWDRFCTAAATGDRYGVSEAADGHHLAVNTQWFRERGTIEIRQRDGSLSFKKIVGWVAYIIATKEHARSGAVYAGQSDYLAWLEDMGFLTAEHRAWAERRVDGGAAPATVHAQQVTSNAQQRLARLRSLQGI